MNAAYRENEDKPRFEVSVAILGYLVLVVLVLDVCARHFVRG